ncbi:MAG: transcription elongation factor GreA [Bdellovibrio sp. CG12_big_fil_rev_8_21_14_0_65_39_13]|nr:MAG: transcription elongation factor GreA [Bdellovibrio sp. CG22_combo_CG10-13_8_21_14_all_39_27]PIQ60881.1 MAG: transcription elongation factor GreA [Bdellovibrio sp. CG12_big_fil_rev_8_21_14_0_65_39_13]PIR36505.1 MAG: transcription elongation factor GreA [Bdellovibrio sp. CG11_big_fil_rev_8_21_14_0_20_39_38]PJB52515.1 MAG: transcription elongation factor GreA [Bdellovibrio sp. CG_4_9_14_3_um_filter_39_7]
MSNDSPITQSGYEKIQAELEHLIKVEREALRISIAEARELGDLKENAEYHAAKEKQGHVEGRIAQLQSVIAKSKIVDVSKTKSSKIVFGATVVLIDQETDESVKYQIVGEEESDTKNKKISYTSPLGKALIGREVGDIVIVKAPRGDKEYEIESINFI